MIDALLWTDRGRGVRAAVFVAALIGSGAYAERHLAGREPAIADLLGDPGRFDGRRVQLITHATEGRDAFGLTLVDGVHRLRVDGEVGHIADGEDVSVEGLFLASLDGAPANRIVQSRVVGHPLRPWKKAVSGTAFVLLVCLMWRAFGRREGGIGPCRTS